MQFHAPHTAAPADQQSMHPLARAAQLRLTLINERGSRASFSAPPPLIQEQLAKQQDGADQRTSPSQIDPYTPTAAFKDVRNISNLIAEYSGSNPTAGANTVQDKETANLIRSGPRRISTLLDPFAMSEQSSLCNPPTKVANSEADSRTADMKQDRTHLQNTYTSSIIEMSEGKVLDEPSPSNAAPLAISEESQASVAPSDPLTLTPSARGPGPRSGVGPNPLQSSLVFRTSPTRPSRSQSSLGVATQLEVISVHETNAQAEENKKGKVHPGAENQAKPRHETRNENKERNAQEEKNKQDQENNSQSSPDATRPPTLEQLLPHDPELKEWLEFTKYFDPQHRQMALKQRKLERLDKEMRVLKAEIDAKEPKSKESEAEESKSTLSAPRHQDKSSASAEVPFIKKKEVPAKVVDKIEPAESNLHRDRPVSSKRSFSYIKDSHDEGVYAKLQRTQGRPVSRGCDSYRGSASDYHNGQGSSSFRYDEDRRRRSPSPDSRFYDSRFSTPRTPRTYDRQDEYDYWNDRESDRWDSRDRSPSASRGGYRGHSHQSNSGFRGRGAGRGSGDFDSRAGTTSLESRITRDRTFKDPKGFERGRKGGQG